jgi:transcriptional regulator with XRE-family HTH domain
MAIESFGSAMRRLRQLRGLSLRRLGHLAYVDFGHLSKIETGLRSPTPKLAAALDLALDASGQLLALAEAHRTGIAESSGTHASHMVDQAKARAISLWRDDLRRTALPRTMLGGASAIAPVWQWENPPHDADLNQHGTRTVSTADINHLRQVRDLYQEMYRRVGGVPVRARIVHTLHTYATPLLAAAYDNETGRALFKAVAGLAALAGVCAYDGDEQPLAQRHLHQALRLAKASGDITSGAYIVSLLATQALHINEPVLAVQYAEAALRTTTTRTSPALAADLHSLAAKAYARIGAATDCHTHMRQSETEAARIDLSDEPAEISYVQPGLIACQHAEALRRLGDLTAALTAAEESVAHLDTIHLRGRVHRLAGLSLVLTARKDVDRSAHIATEMLGYAAGMESGRIHDRVQTVVQALRPHARETSVAAFLSAAAAYGRTAT